MDYWFKSLLQDFERYNFTVKSVDLQDFISIDDAHLLTRFDPKKLLVREFHVEIEDYSYALAAKATPAKLRELVPSEKWGKLAYIKISREKETPDILNFSSDLWIEPFQPGYDDNAPYAFTELGLSFKISNIDEDKAHLLIHIIYAQISKQMEDCKVSGYTISQNYVAQIRSKTNSSAPASASTADPDETDDKEEEWTQDMVHKTAIAERRCCKLSGRLGDKYCNICGKMIPDEWILQKEG